MVTGAEIGSRYTDLATDWTIWGSNPGSSMEFFSL